MLRREFNGRLAAVAAWSVLFHHRAGHSGGPTATATAVRVAQVYLTASAASQRALFQTGVFQPDVFQGA